MSNPPPVKTTFSDPLAADPPSTPAVAAPDELPADPRLAALVRLLRPVIEPKVHPAAESRLPRATSLEVSLSTHRLRVVQGVEVLVESPVATGRTLSPTPEGTFAVAAKPASPTTPRYGHYRSRAGTLLVRGVFPEIDPLPPDAVFDEIAPKGVLQLSGEGPLIFGGEATGVATTDGTLVLPDRIALLLHEKLPLGLPVVIAR